MGCGSSKTNSVVPYDNSSYLREREREERIKQLQEELDEKNRILSEQQRPDINSNNRPTIASRATSPMAQENPDDDEKENVIDYTAILRNLEEREKELLEELDRKNTIISSFNNKQSSLETRALSPLVGQNDFIMEEGYVALLREKDENVNELRRLLDDKDMIISALNPPEKPDTMSRATSPIVIQVKNAPKKAPIKFNERLKSRAKADELEISKLGDGELFVDQNFEHFTEYRSKQDSGGSKLVEIDWLRPHELVDEPSFGFENIQPDEVEQGSLGDCWFIAALSAIARFPQLYSRVISMDTVLWGRDYVGVVCVRFWLYGEWVEVYVDDRLPTNRANKSLIFGRCRTKRTFWVPLIEKAYAKLVGGGYQSLAGGHSRRALVDLTGMVFVTFNPGSYDMLPDRYACEDELMERGELVGCSAIRFSKEDAKSEDDYDGHEFSILAINKYI
jgi:hypothetical protein